MLAKAITLYNGAAFVADSSWETVLRERIYTPNSNGGNREGRCYSCGYSINVRNEHFGMPHRSYIWLGAEAVENNPATPEDESQDAWCFAYGEQEWRDPDLHPVTQQPLNWVGYRDLARIEINRRSECE